MIDQQFEFTRLFAAHPTEGSVRDDETVIDIEIAADGHERKALANRFGLQQLELLKASGTLTVFAHGRGARLDLSVDADVVQTCVVTLEPVAAHISDRLVIRYEAGGRDGESRSSGVEVTVEADEDEIVEPMPSDGIDVGEAVAQWLGLALDPYPRSDQADEAIEALKKSQIDVAAGSPFNILERLKRK